MANPLSEARWFHRVGHVTNTAPLRLLPAPRGVGVLTTHGRRTGRVRKRAMRVVREGDRAYAVAFMGRKTDWLANLRADPDVRIKLGRRTHRARAREISNSDERARAAEVYRPIAGWYDYVDYLTYVWSIPTRSRVLRVHDAWFERGVPVVFELTDGR